MKAVPSRTDCWILFASLFVFVAGLKPFHIGLWFQSEPVLVALMLSGAALALCAVCSHPLRERVLLAWKEPAIRILVAFVAWSMLASGFADFPLRSWMGPPETGEGIFSWLVLVLLTLGAYSLWQQAIYRRRLVVVAVIASMSAILLQTQMTSTDWQPVKWPDFASFVAFFLMIVMLAAPPKLTTWHWIIAGAIGITELMLADSSSAKAIFMLLPVLALGLYGLQHWMGKGERFYRRARQILTGLVVLPIVITLVTVSVEAPQFAQTVHWVDRVVGKILHLDNYDTPDWSFEEGSLGTRVLFNHVATDALIAEPTLLLTGNGWGGFSDLLFRHVFTDGIRLYNDAAKWAPNWFMIAGSAFHCHNMFVEALIATGLIGFLLFSLLPVVIIQRLPQERLLVLGSLWVGVFLLGTFWFMMPLAVPFMALALVASMPPAPSPEKASVLPTPHHALRAGAALLVLLLGGGIWVQQNTAQSAARLMQAIQTRLPEPGDREILQDHHRGNGHLWWIAVNLSTYINGKLERGENTKPDDMVWFKEILAIVGRSIETNQANDRLRGHYVLMHNDLMVLYRSALWDTLRTERMAMWKDVVLSAIHAVPTRGDLALIYHTFFMERITPKEKPAINEGLAARLMEVTEDVLQHNPNDPTALWFSGLVMLRHPDSALLGMQRLLKALDLNAERWVPVSKEVRQNIEKQRIKP